jgi:hypothetical protein
MLFHTNWIPHIDLNMPGYAHILQLIVCRRPNTHFIMKEVPTRFISIPRCHTALTT